MKRFFKNIAMDLLRISAYLLMIFLAVYAVCFLMSLPEIIGMLIFG